MADKYANYGALRKGEVEGRDFQIFTRIMQSSTAVIAPHGGKIERGTSELAKAIAGEVYQVYCFEGLKGANNRDLHITSTNFDEPEALKLVSGCDHVLAIHGCAAGERTIYLGGRDALLRDAIGENLVAGGFRAGIHDNPDLQGISIANICNRGRRSRGVQLEISADLRDEIRNADGAEMLMRLAACIRAGIEAVQRNAA